MKIYDIAYHPDGNVEIKYVNGYKFYGRLDENNYPVEGELLKDGQIIYSGYFEQSYLKYIEEYEENKNK